MEGEDESKRRRKKEVKPWKASLFLFLLSLLLLKLCQLNTQQVTEEKPHVAASWDAGDGWSFTKRSLSASCCLVAKSCLTPL